MASAFVTESAAGTTTITITAASSGNTLVVIAFAVRLSGGARTISSIAATNTTGWQALAVNTDTTTSFEIWVGRATGTTGTTVTLTMSGTGSTVASRCAEFSGVIVPHVIDATSVIATGSSVTPATGAFSSVTADALVIAAELHGNNTTPSASPGAPWTNLTFTSNAFGGFKGAYKSGSHVAGSESASWTITSSTWTAMIGELRVTAPTNLGGGLLLMGVGS